MIWSCYFCTQTISFRSTLDHFIYSFALIASRAWGLMNALGTLSYCRASSVGYLISSELLILALRASMLIALDFRYMIVCGTVRVVFVWIFKSTAAEKWSEIRSDVDTERTLHRLENIRRSRKWPWICVGKLTCLLRSIDSMMPGSCLTSDNEESIWTLKSPISPRSWGILRQCRTCLVTHWRK